MTHGNLCNLAEYGEIMYLFDTLDLVPAIQDNRLQEAISDRLLEVSFHAPLDFFAATGMMTLSHVVLATLVKQYGEINCLLYDRETKRYNVKRVG